MNKSHSSRPFENDYDKAEPCPLGCPHSVRSSVVDKLKHAHDLFPRLVEALEETVDYLENDKGATEIMLALWKSVLKEARGMK